jgi:dehydrogenase/reductase SDR family protein 1
MTSLQGKIALVTGASRGIGRGIALSLGEAGATVYITGRTEDEQAPTVPLSGTIHKTAEEVTRLGGQGIAIRCDHRNDEQTQAVFKQIQEAHGHLDILVNNAWAGYEGYHDGRDFPIDRPFWEKRLSLWDDNLVGVRATYLCSFYAAPLMVPNKSGLIINLSNKIDAPGNPAYCAAKFAEDRLTVDLAHEFRNHGIATIGLYPGLVRTESILKYADHFDMSTSQAPEFVGRAVVALALDADRMRRSGQSLVVTDLAQEYGFKDIEYVPESR